MTSCGGMFSVIVRRSTFTIRSTTGIRMKRPGPFGSGKRRPSRKTIPRSYSRATLIALSRNSSRKNRMTARTTRAAVTPASLHLVNRQGQTVERIDLDALAGRERLGRACAPQLAVDEDEAAVAHDAPHADDLLRPDRDGASPNGHRLAERERPEPAEERRDRHDQRDRRVVRRRCVVEQRGEPD